MPGSMHSQLIHETDCPMQKCHPSLLDDPQLATLRKQNSGNKLLPQASTCSPLDVRMCAGALQSYIILEEFELAVQSAKKAA